MPGPLAYGRRPLPEQGTLAGHALGPNSITDLEAEVDGGGRRLWLPLLNGTERLGVVQMTFAVRDEPLSEGLVALCERYAHLIATLITNKDVDSDLFKLVRMPAADDHGQRAAVGSRGHDDDEPVAPAEPFAFASCGAREMRELVGS